MRRILFAVILLAFLVGGVGWLMLSPTQTARSAPLNQGGCGYWEPPGCRGGPGCVWIPEPSPNCSTPVPVTPRPPGPPPPPPPPCSPIKGNPFQDYGVDDGTLTGHGCSPFSLSVTAPCLSVLRNPYPRGVVSRDNYFGILPQPSSAEASTTVCSTPADCESKGYGEQVRNVVVSLRLALETGVSPVWYWDERLWNVRSGRSSEVGWGWQSSHLYETSSFDVNTTDCIAQYGEGSCKKPANGPSLVAGQNLPAYQVSVHTPWKAYYKVDWEERRQVCRCANDPANHFAPNCCCGQVFSKYARKKENWDWCQEGRDEPPTCWPAQSSGWKDIDLSRYTGGTWWMWSAHAKPAQQNVGCGVIPVPIIEIQGVLDP
jgi:hypothetical protein